MTSNLTFIKNALLSQPEGSLVDRLFIAVCPELFERETPEAVSEAVKSFLAHPSIPPAQQAIYRTLQRVYQGEDVQETNNKVLALAIEKLKEHRPNRIALSAKSLLCSIKPFVWEAAAVLATVVVAGCLNSLQGNRARESKVSCEKLRDGWEHLAPDEQQWLQNLPAAERILTIRDTCFRGATYPCPSSPELFLSSGSEVFNQETAKRRGCSYFWDLFNRRNQELKTSCRERWDSRDCQEAGDCLFEAIKSQECHTWAQPNHYVILCAKGSKRPDCDMTLEEVAQRWELRGRLTL